MNIRTMKRTGGLPRLVTGLSALCVAGLVLLATGTAAVGSTTPPPSPYRSRVLRAVDTCNAQITTQTTLRRAVGCVHDLVVPPAGSNTGPDDPWNDVLDCLSEGWTPGEGDGGFNNAVVNACLVARGVL